MFAQQLLKLVNRLIFLTEEELALVKKMKIKEASIITTEKEPLIVLYQNCIDKIATNKETKTSLKKWNQIDTLKERISVLTDLTNEHEHCIKHIERSQTRFVEMMQEKMVNIAQPIKNYNRLGHMVNRQQYYAKQGGGATSTLDQTL